MSTVDALLIIDYTNDFVASTGQLTCGAPGQAIDAFIASRAAIYLEAQKDIFLPTDLHKASDPYHPETKLFPPHNLANTWGRSLFGATGQWYHEHQNNPRVHFLSKTRYNAFTGTDLDLELRARKLVSLEIVGVCTDICILHTAIGAYDLGYQLTIPASGVATFTESGQPWVLNHFKNVLGATVIV